MSGLRIGQVARETGVAVETIRYYEREGLIPAPARRASGYRDYAPEVIARLRFIRRAKALGFTLREIGELLSLRVDGERTCADVRGRATAKMEQIDERVQELQRMKEALAALAAECAAGRDGPQGDCPILDALESGNDTPDDDIARDGTGP